MAAVDTSATPQPVTPARVERLRALAAWHTEWFAGQVAARVDGPVPASRPEPSDWNLHVPDLRAAPDAEDAFHARAREIMGIAS